MTHITQTPSGTTTTLAPLRIIAHYEANKSATQITLSFVRQTEKETVQTDYNTEFRITEDLSYSIFNPQSKILIIDEPMQDIREKEFHRSFFPDDHETVSFLIFTVDRGANSALLKISANSVENVTRDPCSDEYILNSASGTILALIPISLEDANAIIMSRDNGKLADNIMEWDDETGVSLTDFYSNYPIPYVVMTYRMNQAYGGPEEGGWHYNTYAALRTFSDLEHEVTCDPASGLNPMDFMPKLFPNLNQAQEWTRHLNHLLDEQKKNGSREFRTDNTYTALYAPADNVHDYLPLNRPYYS